MKTMTKAPGSGSDILHGDWLYGAIDVFIKRHNISEASKRNLLLDNTARFYRP